MHAQIIDIIDYVMLRYCTTFYIHTLIEHQFHQLAEVFKRACASSGVSVAGIGPLSLWSQYDTRLRGLGEGSVVDCWMHGN